MDPQTRDVEASQIAPDDAAGPIAASADDDTTDGGGQGGGEAPQRTRDGEPLIRPEGGPGLRRQAGPDPTAWTALIAGILGIVPKSVFASLPNEGHFGPLSFTALFAVVAILFAVIAGMRYVDLRQKRILWVGMTGGVLGLIRLFIYPLAGI